MGTNPSIRHTPNCPSCLRSRTETFWGSPQAPRSTRAFLGSGGRGGGLELHWLLLTPTLDPLPSSLLLGILVRKETRESTSDSGGQEQWRGE